MALSAPTPAALPVASSASGSSPRVHLAFLDGLRAVAALLVVVCHCHVLRVYLNRAPSGVWYDLFDGGGVWVNTFIVLSGFCLMLPVARSGHLRGSWISFYKSRARRILPPLYAVIVLAVLKTLLRDHHIPLEVVLVNGLVLQDLIQAKPILDPPLWTVALEWKIYFLFPPLVWLWARYGLRASLTAAAAISAVLFIVLFGVFTASHNITNMNWTRCWYVFLFALGMASADFAYRSSAPIMPQRLVLTALGAVLALNCMQIYLWPWSSSVNFLEALHQSINDILQGLAVSLLLFLLTRVSTIKKLQLLTPVFEVLSWRPLVFIGTFSYSIYLLHLILIYAIHDFLTAHLHHGGPVSLWLIDIVIVLCASYLFHLAFERPFMTKSGVKIKTEAQAEVAAIVNPAP